MEVLRFCLGYGLSVAIEPEFGCEDLLPAVFGGELLMKESAGDCLLGTMTECLRFYLLLLFVR